MLDKSTSGTSIYFTSNCNELISILICRNWKGSIDVHIINGNSRQEMTKADLEDLRTMVRFPKNTTITLHQGDLVENVIKEKNTDINIFNIEQGITIEEMVKTVNISRISAIFCCDTEFENVLV